VSGLPYGPAPGDRGEGRIRSAPAHSAFDGKWTGATTREVYQMNRAERIKRKPEPEPQPWGSLHSTHSGAEADWCGNCRAERKDTTGKAVA
jgi:hypothetical protein